MSQKYNLRKKFFKLIYTRLNILSLIDNSILVKLILPSSDSDKYKRSVRNLKRLGVQCSFERLITYKLLIMLFTFFILIGFNLYYISYSQDQIIHGNDSTSSEALSFNNISNNSSDEIINSVVEKTAEIQPNYKRLLKNSQYQTLVTYIWKAEKSLNISDTTGNLTKQVLQKFIQAYNIKINPFNIIIYLGISVLMSAAVNIYLTVLNSIRSVKFDNEFKLIELVTLILLKNSTVTVGEILNIHMGFTNILKDEYKRCLTEYSIDKNKAIDNLINDVDDSEFTTFTMLLKENLKGGQDTNIKLLESQKNLNYELDSEKYKEKVSKYSLVFTGMSFPVWIIAGLILFIPIFIKIRAAI